LNFQHFHLILNKIYLIKYQIIIEYITILFMHPLIIIKKFFLCNSFQKEFSVYDYDNWLVWNSKETLCHKARIIYVIYGITFQNTGLKSIYLKKSSIRPTFKTVSGRNASKQILSKNYKKRLNWEQDFF